MNDIKRHKTTLAGKVASFFRGEYDLLTANNDVTLEQLYRRLMTVAARDRLARTRFDEMMFLMASDIREAKTLPQAGARSKIARPMNAWRERYAGLGTASKGAGCLARELNQAPETSLDVLFGPDSPCPDEQR